MINIVCSLSGMFEHHRHFRKFDLSRMIQHSIFSEPITYQYR